MNLYSKLLLAVCCLLFSQTNSYSQDSTAKKYPSLLWEITGPNMSKPSYLFGTMHVSSKLVFHLSDSFFMALKSVEAVGLESRPDEWIEMISNNLNSSNQVQSYINYGYGYNGMTGTHEFTLNKGNITPVLSDLSNDVGLINAFLYRSDGMRNQDFEERTYLDMFIYQSGMKLEKKLVSLEDYQKSTELVNKAYERPFYSEEEYDVYEPMPSSKINYNNYGAWGEEDPMETAYRNGDLDVLDSLEHAQMTDHQYKYMLSERNILMTNRADSIMKTKSLFIAVGAGHLAGELGMIELLREKGYTLRPVMQKGRDDKARRKLEKIQIKPKTIPFVSADSFIQGNFTEKFIQFSENEKSVIMSPDLVNGAHYLIYRNTYHSALFNESPEYVLERIDSFLYENIRGDILKKKNIKVLGYPGYDITNKTRSGTYERSQIIVFPDEIVLIKLGGAEKYVKGKEGKNFFKSLSFDNRFEKKELIKLQTSDLSVEFPHRPWKVNSNTYSKEEVYISSKSNQDNVYILHLNNVELDENFLPDTARLRFALASFKYTDGYTRESSRYVEFLGKTAIEWVGKSKEGVLIKARAFWSGKSILVQAVLVRKESVEVNEFMNSVIQLQPKPLSFQLIQDSVVMASYMALDTPQFTLAMYQEQSYGPWGLPTFKSNFVYNQRKNDQLLVSYSYPSRYSDLNDSSDFTKDKYEFYYLDTTDYIVQKSPIKQNGKFLVKDLLIGDTACSFWSFSRSYWSPEASYTISYLIDSSQAPEPFFTKFLETFSPWDTSLYDNEFARGTDAFWADLASEDTVKIKAAMIKLSFTSLDDSFAYKLISVLDTSKASRNYRVKLRNKLKTLKDPAVRNYYSNLFVKAGDTTSMQIASVSTILNQKDTASIALAKRYLIKNTPLYANESSESYLFSRLFDTLELAQLLLPEVVDLTEYDEYENQVYSLLAKLADSGFIAPGKNTFPLDRLIREAKNELKRATSSGASTNNYYGYSTSEEEKELSYKLSNLLHALFPYKESNNEVKEIFTKAKEIDIKDLKFELVKLQYAIDSSLSDDLLNEIVKSESKRYQLYSWLQERNREKYFPNAYLGIDSMLKPIIKSEIQSYNHDKDSIYVLGKDRIILGSDTGDIYYFRILSKYGNNWSYGCVYLLPSDSINYREGFDVVTNLGVWKESDNLAEKIALYSEKIAISNYKGLPKKRMGVGDFYFDEEMIYSEY